MRRKPKAKPAFTVNLAIDFREAAAEAERVARTLRVLARALRKRSSGTRGRVSPDTVIVKPQLRVRADFEI